MGWSALSVYQTLRTARVTTPLSPGDTRRHRYGADLTPGSFQAVPLTLCWRSGVFSTRLGLKVFVSWVAPVSPVPFGTSSSLC